MFFSFIIIIIFIYYSSWKKTVEKFTNMVNTNSQLFHSRHLFDTSIELATTSFPSVRDKKQTNYVLCSQNSLHNDARIANNDNIQSCGTAIKQNYSIPTTSNTNHYAQIISTTSASMLNLHTTTILTLVGK